MFRKVLSAIATISLFWGSPALADSLLITNARTLDLTADGPVIAEDVDVLVIDGIVAKIAPSGTLDVDADVEVRDAAGATLMPGLTDMHVHLWDEASLGGYLAAGVTTIRNMSGMPFHIELAKRIESGDLLGPRLLTTGPILNSPGPNQQINHQLVGTAAEARAAVQAQAAAGYDRIKLYSNLRREAFEAAVDEAGKQGMRVTGHTPEGERLDGIPSDRDFLVPFAASLSMGFETIEHSESIFWHALKDTPDADAELAVAKAIAAAGVPVTATLVAEYNLYRVAESKGAFAKRAGVERLNPVAQGFEQEYIDAWSQRNAAAELARAQQIWRLTATMQREGVLLVSGSDAGIFTNIPGVSLHDELDLLVRAGLTEGEALATATRNSAVALGEGETSGCLREGCVANLVLYACDPLANIACIREPAAVVRGGDWFGRARLDALLEASTRHNPERTMANLLAGMEAQGSPLDPALLGQ